MIGTLDSQSITSTRFMGSPFHVFAKNKEGYYLFCNAAMARDLGLPDTQAIVGKSDKELIWKDFANGLREHDQCVMEEKSDHDFVEPVRILSKPNVNLLSHKFPISHITNSVAGGVFGVSFIRGLPNKFNYLSDKQKQCIKLTIQGFSAKEIAKIMHISYRTVEEYLEKAKIRFNCRNKTQLIASYIKETLLLG
jgi:DNA-binding CsgD family transcriptional regulator